MGDTEISGELFLAAISYIETNHGVKAWKKIAGDLSKELKGLKLSNQERYPFPLLVLIATNASKNLKIATTEFFASVGHHWISFMIKDPDSKGILSTLGGSFPAALYSLNSLHKTVSESGLYPNLSCPQLEVLSESQGWIKCLYTPGSPVRCGVAQHIMVGIIKGLGKTFFGLTYVDVMISEERPGPITSYVLEVSYSMNLADQASIATTEAGFDFVLENCHINSLFPFHFVVDNSNTIVFGGPSFQKCFPSYVGKEAQEITVTYPNTAAGPFDMGGLSHLTFRLDLCCVVIDGVELKGQVLFQNDHLAFLGNPVFTCLDEMINRGLSISDFAFHDTGVTSIYSPFALEASKKEVKLDSKFKVFGRKKRAFDPNSTEPRVKRISSAHQIKKRTSSPHLSSLNSSASSPPCSPRGSPMNSPPRSPSPPSSPLSNPSSPLAPSPVPPLGRAITPDSPHIPPFTTSVSLDEKGSGKKCPFSSSGGVMFSTSPVPPLSFPRKVGRESPPSSIVKEKSKTPKEQKLTSAPPLSSVPPLNSIPYDIFQNNDVFRDNFPSSNSPILKNSEGSEGCVTPRGKKAVLGRQGSGSKLFATSPFGGEVEVDPYAKFCELFYQDASVGFPFTLQLLQLSESSEKRRLATSEALLDFFSETGAAAELIKITLKKDLLSELSSAEYLRGTSTGVRLTGLFLNRYAGNFISSFCGDLSTLDLESEKNDTDLVTSFLKKRVESHLNPQVCQLLLWIFKTVKENSSKEIAGLAITNLFFLRFVLARMVQVSPRTKGMAKKIQKQCTPHHPFVFEMMDMCALKSYSETDSVANLFRKKLSSTHSSGAAVIKETCFHFMEDLLATKEGKAVFIPILTSTIGF